MNIMTTTTRPISVITGVRLSDMNMTGCVPMSNGSELELSMEIKLDIVVDDGSVMGLVSEDEL